MLIEKISLFRNMFYSVKLAHPDTFFWICADAPCCNLNVTMYDAEIRIAKTTESQGLSILVKVVLNEPAQLAFVQHKRPKEKSLVNLDI
jgi:hypothetical protein